MNKVLLFILIGGLLISWYFLGDCPNLSEYIINVLIAIGTIGATAVALQKKSNILCKVISIKNWDKDKTKYKTVTLYIKNNTPSNMIIHQGYFLSPKTDNSIWMTLLDDVDDNKRLSIEKFKEPIYPFWIKELKICFSNNNESRKPKNEVIRGESELGWGEKIWNKLFRIAIIVFPTTIGEIRIRVNVRNLYK